MKYSKIILQLTGRISALTIGLIFGLLTLSQTTATAASTASLSLVSDSASVVQSSNFTVTVQVNAGVAVNVIQAHVTYNASQLNYVNSDCSVWPASADSPEASVGPGFIHLSRFVLSAGQSGSFAVCKLTFKALTNSVSSALSIDMSKSSVLESATPNANILTTVNGTSVNLTPIPPAAPSAAPSSSTPKSTVTPPVTVVKPSTSLSTTTTPSPAVTPIIVTKPKANHKLRVSKTVLIIIISVLVAATLFILRKKMIDHRKDSFHHAGTYSEPTNKTTSTLSTLTSEPTVSKESLPRKSNSNVQPQATIITPTVSTQPPVSSTTQQK